MLPGRSSGGRRHCGSRHRGGRTCSRNRRCAIPIRFFEKRSGPALRLSQRKDLHMSKVQPTAGLVTAGMIGGYVAARVIKSVHWVASCWGPAALPLDGAGTVLPGRALPPCYPSSTWVPSAHRTAGQKIGSWPSVLVSTARRRCRSGAQRQTMTTTQHETGWQDREVGVGPWKANGPPVALGSHPAGRR